MLERIIAASEVGAQVGTFRIGFSVSGKAASALGEQEVPLQPTSREVFFSKHTPREGLSVEERVIVTPAHDHHTRFRYDAIVLADGDWHLHSAQFLHWMDSDPECQVCSLSAEISPQSWALGNREPNDLIATFRAGDALPPIATFGALKPFAILMSLVVAAAVIVGWLFWR